MISILNPTYSEYFGFTQEEVDRRLKYYGLFKQRSLVENADPSIKGELEVLLAGGTIEKPVHEEITYDSVYDSEDNLWNFLFFTGYLKLISRRLEGENRYITMGIPNLEVKYIYSNMSNYIIKSNRESGNGRLDIAVRSLDIKKTPIIMEIKVSETFKGLETACDKAIRQIVDMEYDSWVPEDGYTEVLDYGIAFFRKRCKIKLMSRRFT